MYFDGSLMKKGVGVGLVFVLPLGVCTRYMVRIHFPSSNNVAEYEALINGLCITIELGIRWLDVWGDSQLVIDQVMKESSYHNTKMAAYSREVRQLEDKFDGLELNHIPMVPCARGHAWLCPHVALLRVGLPPALAITSARQRCVVASPGRRHPL